MNREEAERVMRLKNPISAIHEIERYCNSNPYPGESFEEIDGDSLSEAELTKLLAATAETNIETSPPQRRNFEFSREFFRSQSAFLERLITGAPHETVLHIWELVNTVHVIAINITAGYITNLKLKNHEGNLEKLRIEIVKCNMQNLRKSFTKPSTKVLLSPTRKSRQRLIDVQTLDFKHWSDFFASSTHNPVIDDLRQRYFPIALYPISSSKLILQAYSIKFDRLLEVYIPRDREKVYSIRLFLLAWAMNQRVLFWTLQDGFREATLQLNHLTAKTDKYAFKTYARMSIEAA